MKFIIYLILLCATSNLYALSETEIVDLFCKGIIEHQLPDNTRIDCWTDTHAEEWDWATGKVYECIGQALHYSRMTGYPPKCVLIKKSNSAVIYYNRAVEIVKYWELPVEIELINQKGKRLLIHNILEK